MYSNSDQKGLKTAGIGGGTITFGSGIWHGKSYGLNGKTKVWCSGWGVFNAKEKVDWVGLEWRGNCKV